MKRINLANYAVKTRIPNIDPDGPPLLESTGEYAMKDSVLNLLFVPSLQLTGAELVKQNVLAAKIEDCKEESILLEDGEWERLNTAVNTHKGFGRNDVEFVRRILEAESVVVEEVKEK